MQRTGGFDNQAAIALKLTLPTVAKKHDDESSLQSTLLHKQHFSTNGNVASGPPTNAT